MSSKGNGKVVYVICCLLLATSSLQGSAVRVPSTKGVKRAATTDEEGRRTCRRAMSPLSAESASQAPAFRAVLSSNAGNRGATWTASSAAGNRKTDANLDELDKLKKDLFTLCRTPGSTREQVEALLGTDTRLDLNKVLNKNGKLPLLVAAEHGNADIVAALLERGADCTIHDARGLNVLCHAACWGLSDVLRALHKHLGQESFTKHAHTKKQSDSLLSLAIQRCHREVIKVLRQLLSDKDFQNMIPTSLPLQVDRHAFVETYVGQGPPERLCILYDLMGREKFKANAMKTNAAGHTMLYAIISDQLGVATIETLRQLLGESSFAELMALSASLKENLVRQAAKRNSDEFVRFFYKVMDQDVFVQAVRQPDKKRRTVLHIAARYASPKIIEALWQLLANDEFEALLFMKNKEGETFLHACVYGVNGNAIRLCKARTCFAELKGVKNAHGKTAYEIAVDLGTTRIASLIAGK